MPLTFQPYSPMVSLTVTVGITTANQPIGLQRNGNIRFAVYGDEPVYVAFGTAAVVATLTSMLLLPGSVEVFDVPDGSTHIAYIAEQQATTKLNWTIGLGGD